MEGEISFPPELSEGTFRQIRYERLPWEEKATLMWSWYWRASIITFATALSATFLGGIFGGFIAVAVGQLHAPALETLVYIIATVIGFFPCIRSSGI